MPSCDATQRHDAHKPLGHMPCRSTRDSVLASSSSREDGNENLGAGGLPMTDPRRLSDISDDAGETGAADRSYTTGAARPVGAGSSSGARRGTSDVDASGMSSASVGA